MAVTGMATLPEGSAVVLMEESERRALLILVGGSEAISIASRIEHRHQGRPLTHDLLDEVVLRLGGDLVSVRVDRVEDGVFFGSVLIAKEGRIFELEARPGDALALAVGRSLPVFVANGVVLQAGIDVEKLDVDALLAPKRRALPGRREIRPGETEI